MVEWRNVVSNGAVLHWWDNRGNQIGFSRGNRGFIAFNNENYNMNEWLDIGLPAGVYCEVISDAKINNVCTRKSITVYTNGCAHFSILTSDFDGVIAIRIYAKL
ncbi:hypothetical protein PVAND_007794 [Polypedilum vanderplanki]|uniref:Alpha-amylase C-terminal domain-containing protein n=1 Tax=Polypedilum vanderplanki TaxID=319348 RepID=A0A9J6C7F6_POLVA|nr:hypothetical protein PVAND_007794 [Polypedilum vanderplanki]